MHTLIASKFLSRRIRRSDCRRPGGPLTALALAVAGLSGCAGVTTEQVESRLETLAFQPNMYVVQAGDTLETVAFRYQLDPSELAALNPGVGQHLRPGERINVRPGTQLSDELRARAFVAPAPPVGQNGAASVESPPPVVTASVPAPVNPAPVVQPAPARPEIIITEAAFDPVTGGHPNEEVIADDLDFIAPSSGYTPVPGAAELGQGSSGWVWPTEGQVARGFAPEVVGGQGVDIAGSPGQDVRAATSGTVVYSGKDPSGSGGSLVILRHPDGLMTTYSHADKLFVTEDDVVQAGDPIASLGWNEASESVLSFEVRRDGAPLNPLDYIVAR